MRNRRDVIESDKTPQSGKIKSKAVFGVIRVNLSYTRGHVSFLPSFAP